MDESKRVKYIICVGGALLLLIVVYLFFRGYKNMDKSKSSQGQKEIVSTSVRDNTDIKAEEISEAVSSYVVQSKKPGVAPEEQDSEAQRRQEEIDAERVQAKLRQQLEDQKRERELSPAPAVSNIQKEKPIKAIQRSRDLSPAPAENSNDQEAQEQERTSSVSMEKKEPQKQSRFFSGEERSQLLPYFEVFGEQKVGSGDRLRLISTKEINIDDLTIPNGTIVYGVVSIGDRANVRVENISINGRLFAIHKNLSDNDGSVGINIGQPQKKEGSEKLQKGRDVLGNVPFVGGVAGSVIRTVSNSISVLFGENEGDVKVVIQGNYKLYIL